MQSSWSQIQAAYADLMKAAKRGEALAQPWARYAEHVAATAASPPYHLVALLETLAAIAKPKPDIRILEHGCGGGAALLYLLARGFTGVHGVDLDVPLVALQRITAVAGLGDPRFAAYDGRTLPYPDASFDLVFSQQVLEHVAPDVIGAYYREEARVLVPGGIAYHQVPHRLIPYDSQTRTWLLHYLPWPLARWCYRRLGRDSAVAREHLFLRMPGFHRRRMRALFGHCEDRTARRLRELKIEGYYDGPIGLRRAMGALVRAPVVGRLAAAVLANLVMLDTVSVKRAPTDPPARGPKG